MSFGPKPPSKSGAVGKQLPVILGMSSFYDTGKPADESMVRMLADRIYSVARSQQDAFVTGWREGERKQEALS